MSARCAQRNEDSYLARPEAGIWAVADGMGGHDAGELASATVIEALESIERAALGRGAAGLVRAARRRGQQHACTNWAAERGGVIGTTIAVLLAL